jgi:hypothetical protein
MFLGRRQILLPATRLWWSFVVLPTSFNEAAKKDGKRH